MSDVKCATIARATFEKVLGPLQQLVEQAQRKKEAEAEARRRMLEAQGLHNCSVRSFGFDGVARRNLPSGGAVLRVTHHTTQKVYSLRVESKARLAHDAGGGLGAQAEVELLKQIWDREIWDRDQARAEQGLSPPPTTTGYKHGARAIARPPLHAPWHCRAHLLLGCTHIYVGRTNAGARREGLPDHGLQARAAARAAARLLDRRPALPAALGKRRRVGIVAHLLVHLYVPPHVAESRCCAPTGAVRAASAHGPHGLTAWVGGAAT